MTKLKKPPKNSKCEAGFAAEDCLGHPIVKKCGKPATNVIMAIFETWVCKECYDKMKDSKYQKKV